MSTPADLEAFYERGASQYDEASRNVPLRAFQVAQQFLPPITADSYVHDNACGPGVVTKDIISQALAAGTKPPKIYATDNSAPMVNQVRKRKETLEGWTDVQADVMDGVTHPGLQDETFTHSVTNFGAFEGAGKGMYRVLMPGGAALMTMFKTQPMVDLANEVKEAIHPGLPPFPPIGRDWWFGEWVR